MHTVLSLCVVFQSLRRSHASQVESISASKSAHASGAGGGGKEREKHQAGNRDGRARLDVHANSVKSKY